jgi:hypothetical protein
MTRYMLFPCIALISCQNAPTKIETPVENSAGKAIKSGAAGPQINSKPILPRSSCTLETSNYGYTLGLSHQGDHLVSAVSMSMWRTVNESAHECDIEIGSNTAQSSWNRQKDGSITIVQKNEDGQEISVTIKPLADNQWSIRTSSADGTAARCGSFEVPNEFIATVSRKQECSLNIPIS